MRTEYLFFSVDHAIQLPNALGNNEHIYTYYIYTDGVSVAKQ
jgi:hypothetical protein